MLEQADSEALASLLARHMVPQLHARSLPSVLNSCRWLRGVVQRGAGAAWLFVPHHKSTPVLSFVPAAEHLCQDSAAPVPDWHALAGSTSTLQQLAGAYTSIRGQRVALSHEHSVEHCFALSPDLGTLATVEQRYSLQCIVLRCTANGEEILSRLLPPSAKPDSISFSRSGAHLALLCLSGVGTTTRLLLVEVRTRKLSHVELPMRTFQDSFWAPKEILAVLGDNAWFIVDAQGHVVAQTPTECILVGPSPRTIAWRPDSAQLAYGYHGEGVCTLDTAGRAEQHGFWHLGVALAWLPCRRLGRFWLAMVHKGSREGVVVAVQAADALGDPVPVGSSIVLDGPGCGDLTLEAGAKLLAVWNSSNFHVLLVFPAGDRLCLVVRYSLLTTARPCFPALSPCSTWLVVDVPWGKRKPHKASNQLLRFVHLPSGVHFDQPATKSARGQHIEGVQWASDCCSLAVEVLGPTYDDRCVRLYTFK